LTLFSRANLDNY